MKRAERKKARKQFHVGDVITWELGICAHRIVEVHDTGVTIDVTSHSGGSPGTDARYYGDIQPDGKIFFFVAFDKNNRQHGGRGPIVHTDMEPDKDYPLSDDVMAAIKQQRFVKTKA